MKAVALAMALLLGSTALAQDADGGTDAPYSTIVESGAIIPRGSSDQVVVGEGLYFNATAAINLSDNIAKLRAERDALATAYDESSKQLEAKTNGTVIAAIIIGVVCLGGGVAIGLAVK